MSSERIQNALTIFRKACELPEHERAALVKAACAGDDALAAEVGSMLAWDDSLDDGQAPHPVRAVLADLAERAGSDHQEAPEPDEPLPAAIGGYRIVRRIARGGMGDVFEAHQSQPSRRVALKVARGGTTGERARRFALEVQLLASLRHPGIASIIEAGTTGEADGARPFFAMDFVDGRPLTDYAAEHLTDARERVELMAKVCAAVAYAHTKGVVHRDLKPDNVLVDGDGAPRVLDFGIAKVQEAGGFGAATLRTEAGRVLGTMGYMAPEQLAGESAISPGADVYSLGVMLYELLTGRLPHDLSRATLTSALAIVASTDAPLLGVIRPDLRGDIEAVVAKALEKDPRHRYADAGALQQDLARHLRGEPTLARPAGPLLRLSKWTRRNPQLASSVFGLFLTLTAVAILLGVSTTEAHAALTQQKRLLDVRRASMARSDTEKLWPTRPATAFALQQWLDEERELEARLPGYRAWLEQVRARSGSFVDSRWTFADNLLQLEHDDVAQMVQDLEALQSDEDLLARVRSRLELARTIVEQTVTSRQADWDAINQRIGKDHPRYRPGLQIVPRVGFVPLGPDPDSHLEEFLALDTHEGPIPARDEHGKFTITEQTGVILVLLPGGTFTMGAQSKEPGGPNYDPQAWAEEGPPHEVTLDPFYISKYEVTRGQWRHVTIGALPFGNALVEPQPLLLPAGNIGRNEWIRRLAHLEMALPTEAQWEYAARGVDAEGHPSSTIWPGCAEREDLAGKANLAGSETGGKGPFRQPDPWKQDNYQFAAPVGRFPPNGFGLHDVMGNLAEWCIDPYSRYGEANLRPGDGYRQTDEAQLVFRGGCFMMGSVAARTAMRFQSHPSQPKMFDVGVRPVALCARRAGS